MAAPKTRAHVPSPDSGARRPPFDPGSLASDSVRAKLLTPMEMVEEDNVAFVPMLRAIRAASAFTFELSAANLSLQDDVLGTIVCHGGCHDELSRHVVRCRSLETAMAVLQAATELQPSDIMGAFVSHVKSAVVTKLKGCATFFERPSSIEDDAAAASVVMARNWTEC